MKIKKLLIAVVLMFSSILFVPSANANCSALDPCITYAEVDSSGTVLNIIVCQPSVCGSNGSWGGKLGNNRLVPQVAADPVTHQNAGGVLNSSGQKVTESNGVFTVPGEKNTETKTETVQEVGVVTTISATIKNNTDKVFTYEDTKSNPHKIEYKSAPVGATVSIEENDVNDSFTTKIDQDFYDRVTSENFEKILNESYTNNSNILELIGKWMQELKSMLTLWFL
jgi:hypothetical protein